MQTDQAVPMVPVAKSSGHESDHCPSPIHDGNQEHHHKKSVLAKVKEKAKKWKSLLTKKKHEGSSMPTTPSNTDEDDESVGHDPEYYGAPSNILTISSCFHTSYEFASHFQNELFSHMNNYPVPPKWNKQRDLDTIYPKSILQNELSTHTMISMNTHVGYKF